MDEDRLFIYIAEPSPTSPLHTVDFRGEFRDGVRDRVGDGLPTPYAPALALRDRLRALTYDVADPDERDAFWARVEVF